MFERHDDRPGRSVRSERLLRVMIAVLIMLATMLLGIGERSVTLVGGIALGAGDFGVRHRHGPLVPIQTADGQFRGLGRGGRVGGRMCTRSIATAR